MSSSAIKSFLEADVRCLEKILLASLGTVTGGVSEAVSSVLDYVGTYADAKELNLLLNRFIDYNNGESLAYVKYIFIPNNYHQ